MKPITFVLVVVIAFASADNAGKFDVNTKYQMLFLHSSEACVDLFADLIKRMSNLVRIISVIFGTSFGKIIAFAMNLNSL